MRRGGAMMAVIVPPLALIALEWKRLSHGRGGAMAFVDHAHVSHSAIHMTTITAIAAFVLYAWAMKRLVALDDDSVVFSSKGCQRVQELAGALMWGLIAAHLVALWVWRWKLDPSPVGQYEFWRNHLSMPFVVAMYAVGLSAAGLFFSQAIAAAVRVIGLARTSPSRSWCEASATLLAACLVMVSIQTLSHYATGRVVWWDDVAERAGKRAP